ncbi:S8 family serine peptidase [Bacteroidota bacterium]
MNFIHKSCFTFLIWILFVPSTFGQNSPHKTFLISFTDKNNSPYSVSKPLEYLSQRAIDRRERMNISLTEQDFPVNPEYLDSLQSKGARILFTSKWLNTATVEVDTELVIHEIEKFMFVQKSERIFRSAKDNTEALTATKVNSSTTEDPAYGASYNQLEMLNGQFLHQKGYTGKGVVIAVLDAGFDRVDSLEAFSHIFSEHRILATHDFVEGDDSVFAHHSHGMYVLSTIAGRLWGKLIGTASDASFILLRSENGDSEYIIEEDAWVAAAEFADSAGADVINSSLSYSVFDDSSMNHTYEHMDGNTTRVSIGADIAASRGLIVVVSAGNSGRTDWKYISAPADADSVLAVGAVDENRVYAAFSSIGPSSDGDVKPNVVAQGMNTVVALPEDGFIGMINGTSLSAPVLTGMIACLVQAFPDKNNMEIIHAVEKSAHLYPFPNDLLGYGLPDFALAYRFLANTEDDLAPDLEVMEIYPNPFRTGIIVSIFTKKENNVSIRISNLIGQVCYEENVNAQPNSLEKIRIDLSGKLMPGLYLLTIGTADQAYQYKIIHKK